MWWTVLRIQTLFIRILLFTLIRIRILLFNLIWIWIPLFDTVTELECCRFKEVMYLKQYFSYILTWFSLSVDPPGPNQKASFVKFSLLVHSVVLIRVSYGFGSRSTRNLGMDPDPGKWYGSLRIRIRNTSGELWGIYHQFLSKKFNSSMWQSTMMDTLQFNFATNQKFCKILVIYAS
jgi:hypothetical protein